MNPPRPPKPSPYPAAFDVDVRLPRQEQQRRRDRPAAAARARRRPHTAGCAAARRDTSEVDPPPSRLSAVWQPRAASSSASSSSVSPASRRERPSQATASRRPGASPSAARGWRPSVMSESNCAWPAEKPSGSSARSKHGAPSRTSSGPACSRSPRGWAGSSSRWPIAHAPAVDAHARAHVVPRAGERHVAASDPVRAQLTQRHAAGADEEAAHQRVLDPARGAPRLEPLGLAQDRDAQLGRALGIRGDVDGGGDPAGERDPCACEAPAARVPRRGARRPWQKGPGGRGRAREHACDTRASPSPPGRTGGSLVKIAHRLRRTW